MFRWYLWASLTVALFQSRAGAAELWVTVEYLVCQKPPGQAEADTDGLVLQKRPTGAKTLTMGTTAVEIGKTAVCRTRTGAHALDLSVQITEPQEESGPEPPERRIQAQIGVTYTQKVSAAGFPSLNMQSVHTQVGLKLGEGLLVGGFKSDEGKKNKKGMLYLTVTDQPPKDHWLEDYISEVRDKLPLLPERQASPPPVPAASDKP